MDSDLDVAEGLLAQGRDFTFENFSDGNESFPGQYGGPDKPEWVAWKTRTQKLVTRLALEHLPAFRLAQEGVSVSTAGYGAERFERAKSTLVKALESVVSSLRQDVYGELRTTQIKEVTPERRKLFADLFNRVFVVHGHDSGLKTDLERFLREIGLEPVVLHRQPDEGATIIE